MDERPIRPFPYPSPPPALRPWNPPAAEVAARVMDLIAERLPDASVEHVGSSPCLLRREGNPRSRHPLSRRHTHLAAINDAPFALEFGRQRNRDPFPETRPMRIGAIGHEDETFLLHVHVVPESGPETTELRDFRAQLRADPGLVVEYVAAKRTIIDAGVCDGDDYAVKKGEFITALGYKRAEDA